MMIDRDKLMKALECCAMIDGTCRCTDCPYYEHVLEEDNFHECDERMQLDVLELMRADQTELIRQRDIIAKLQAALDLANGKLVNMGYEPYDLNDGRDALHNAIKAAQEPMVPTLYEPTRERQLEALVSWLTKYVKTNKEV